MSNPIKMALAELLEYNPLDVPKWATNYAPGKSPWKKIKFLFFIKEKGHKERANKYKTKILLYKLSFYENGRRLDNPLWRPVMSYCLKSDE
jgi:hypothetical protein